MYKQIYLKFKIVPVALCNQDEDVAQMVERSVILSYLFITKL